MPRTHAHLPFVAAASVVAVLGTALLWTDARRLADTLDDCLTGAPGCGRADPVIQVAGRSLVRDGRPFVWLADDAPALLSALNRTEVGTYLDARADQGFTVVLSSLDVPYGQYGDEPFDEHGEPVVTPGHDPADDGAYDFWDHVDWVVSEAAARGLVVALEPAGDGGFGEARDVVRMGDAGFAALPADPCAEPGGRAAPDDVRPFVGGAVREDVPSCSGGRASARDVRGDAWHALLSGAAGYTYGHAGAEGFPDGWSLPGAATGGAWTDALDAAGANQLRHLRALLESRPQLRSDDGPGGRGTVVEYSGESEVTVDLDTLAGDTAQPWWFDPRTGEATELEPVPSEGRLTLPTPDDGEDWALVVDDADAGNVEPGAVEVGRERDAAGPGPDPLGDGMTGAGGRDPDEGWSRDGEDPADGGPGDGPDAEDLAGEDPAGEEPDAGNHGDESGSADDGSAPGTGEPTPAAPPATDGTWDRLAACESSGDWAIDSGNGYYGGLQFDEATWGDYDGAEFAPRADQATKEQQIEVATRVRDDRGGYGSWPACARKLGLPR